MTSKGLQVFWCGWWHNNNVRLRPADKGECDGLWLQAMSESTDVGESSIVVNVLLSEQSVERLQALIEEWLASRSWPTKSAVLSDRLPEPEADDDE